MKVLQRNMDVEAALPKDAEATEDLPRHAMGLYLSPQDLRVCRSLINKWYLPMDVIELQTKFHNVFIQVVRGMPVARSGRAV